MLCHGSTSPSTLASAPPLSTPLFLEEEEAGGRGGRRGQRQEKKKRRSEERGDKCEGRCTDGKPVYRPTCRLCNFNGGSGVSWRIVRSRGATSPGKGGTGCGGNRRRCRHGRKGGRKGGENRSEGGVSQA